MVSGKSDLIEIEAFVRIVTDRAYGIEDPHGLDGKGELIWVPKSQCELTEDGLVMPEWLAIEKGLV